MKKIALFLAVLPCIGYTGTASAQLLNGGLESPVVPVATFTQYSGGQLIGGAWVTLGNDVLVINNAYTESGVAFNASEGVQCLDLTGAGNTGLSNGVVQLVPTQIGQGYSIGFSVGRASGNSNYATSSRVDLSVNGGTRLGFINNNASAGAVNWQSFFYNFIATGTSTSIAFYNGTADNNFAGLDNVSVVAVPETSSALFLGVPLVLLGVARRRR